MCARMDIGRNDGISFRPRLPRLYTKPKLVTFMIHPMLKIDVFVQSTVSKMDFLRDRMMRNAR